ncbi:hypothetical protein [Limnochorda pilosa]|uniref:Uncharacterized protein n=1 Tax=Limnochorda pilosa TaxID=1555112 RepID=A0A0K2SLR0_LIMPI|nr:hypothetical protein [Limnochorda pilosa]BAS28061.1 hypothetical protein LIP_2220 [Limnochorda pilosa]
MAGNAGRGRFELAPEKERADEAGPFERLDWQVAERDDARLARAVAEHRELDAVHNLEEGGLLDGFMAFLREIGFLAYLERLRPSRRERFMVEPPPSSFSLT